MLDDKLTSINFDTCIYFTNYYITPFLSLQLDVCNLQNTTYL